MASVDFECEHYKRKCQFVTPCCQKIYPCRFCHDDNEPNHKFKRSEVREIVCSKCYAQQTVSNVCVECGITFGKYYCEKCRLYDDEDKKQFHCDDCGLCRIGGRDNYFHCVKCGMCLSKEIRDSHTNCIEAISRRDCPICLEDLHTSRISSFVPSCNHMMHTSCKDEMVKKGQYACPICGVSLMDMEACWKMYDEEVREIVLPEKYRDLHVKIYCRDCQKIEMTSFHFVGLKCAGCGSYNTNREKGPFHRKDNDGAYVETWIEDDNPTDEGASSIDELETSREDESN